jgi:predicted MPP superfamily phosphohydrolase
MAATHARAGFTIEHVRLTGPRLPAGAPPLRFAALSDTHMDSFTPLHERLAAAVNDADVDFVLLAGDLARRVPEGWESLGRLVRLMHCRHGIYAVRGNWEFKFPHRSSVLKEMMQGWGAELLLNESRTLRTASGVVQVCGIDDIAGGWPDYRSALRGAAEADFAVFLCHEPLASRLLPPESGIGLTFCGHTHGGQIRIPYIWRLALPEYSGELTMGLYPTERGPVYVSRGLGASGPAPLRNRFRCPRELTVFEVARG